MSIQYKFINFYRMSLDCYPFGERKTIELSEQPLAIDVAYEDNLFVSVVDQCECIVVYDLLAPQKANKLIKKFKLGKGIVVDQIVYCRTGDYLACVGHKNGLLSIYTIFNWRLKDEEPMILELSVNVESEDEDRRNKLNSIDCCQKTGNLAVSCGDIVLIYKYIGDIYEDGGENDDNDKDNESEDVDEHDLREGVQNSVEKGVVNGISMLKRADELHDDISSSHSKAETVREKYKPSSQTGDNFELKQHFKHIISIKLTIWALKICLLENYLSITAVDHVQVLKLELLTLQIQSDGLDGGGLFKDGPPMQTNDSGSDPTNFNGIQSETTSTTVTTTSTNIATTSCSLISDSDSTTTNFSSFNNTTGEQLNNSDMSIITMNQQDMMAAAELDTELNCDSNQSTDDCITWNLNTKKLVKLPTLMHNTSTNLSSYHICHPLELLGPASESIACRVKASIYSQDYCQNQLEAVVMLCKQFDFDRDPVKTTYLQAVYLSNYEDQKRLKKSALNINHDHDCICDQASGSGKETTLLKSSEYELLASVTCFVSTMTNCFVYSLQGKKVIKSQTITHPDLCLDLRPDLLNIYLLTPLGLQICSTGICDTTFRYDWSSSSDLNLSFIASDRSRVLTSENYLITVSCSLNGQCIVECLAKPSLISLFNRIVHTVERCNSISIRSNLLTYLHATAQLALLTQSGRRRSIRSNSSSTSEGKSSANLHSDSMSGEETTNILRVVTIMLCKQLMQKKQTNVITNSKIDRAIKHLLDISMCDLNELMKRHLSSNKIILKRVESISSDLDDLNSADQSELTVESLERKILDLNLFPSTTLGDDDKPLDTDYELIKIYLKHAKYNQSLLDYLVSNSSNEIVSKKIIGYIFDHNPRLLIKCAQRYPLNKNGNDLDQEHNSCVLLLVNKLRQLAEFDSTGINRATVLFTLAILYNALGEKQKCLATLEQIKPQNHLAITMCSNYELSHPIASLVNEYYPDVFNLFLIQLTKRDKFAAREFAEIQTNSNVIGSNNNNCSIKSNGSGKNRLYHNFQDVSNSRSSGDLLVTSRSASSASFRPISATNDNHLSVLNEDDETQHSWSNGSTSRTRNQIDEKSYQFSGYSEERDNGSQDYDYYKNEHDNNDNENDDNDDDEGELFERKLKLISEIPTLDLIDLLSSQTTTTTSASTTNTATAGTNTTHQVVGNSKAEKQATKAYLEASINLLESQFILARLRENSY